MTSLCTKGVWACSITRPPGYVTITFLPDGFERPFAFLNCTFEGPKSRPPSANFYGQLCYSQALSSGRNSPSRSLLLPSTLRTHAPEVSTPSSSSSDRSPKIPDSPITSVSFYRRYGCSRRHPINDVDFLVLGFCRTLAAFCHLSPFLPQWRHPPANLAGLFLSGASFFGLALAV